METNVNFCIECGLMIPEPSNLCGICMNREFVESGSGADLGVDYERPLDNVD